MAWTSVAIPTTLTGKSALKLLRLIKDLLLVPIVQMGKFRAVFKAF